MPEEDSTLKDIDAISELSVSDANTLVDDLIANIESAVVGEREFFELLLTGVIARGHVHLEDVPGTGKTVAAQVLAESMGMTYNRIQFTPDLLPADVTGSHVYNEVEKTFEFQKGPIFANVVLADEINRAPPKTQAALLEAMGEGQVSVDGETFELPKPFFVIATQNPVDQQGTFELPEAQKDRFSIKTKMGYPGHDGEMELLSRREGRRKQVPTVESLSTPDEIRQLQATAETIAVEDEVKEYIVEVAEQTRNHEHTKIGVSPRGVQKMFEAARGYAVINGRDYVTPNDVKVLAESVYSHRCVLTNEAKIRDVEPSEVVAEGLSAVPVPGIEQ